MVVVNFVPAAYVLWWQVVLVPSSLYLFRVFKWERVFAVWRRGRAEIAG